MGVSGRIIQNSRRYARERARQLLQRQNIKRDKTSHRQAPTPRVQTPRTLTGTAKDTHTTTQHHPGLTGSHRGGWRLTGSITRNMTVTPLNETGTSG